MKELHRIIRVVERLEPSARRTAPVMDTNEILKTLLMFFILPLWLAAGFADYLCHRSAHIEKTSGWKESLLHLLQFIEMGIPVLAALFLEIDAGVILLMIICLVLHEATAMWDVSYASQTREVPPIEQHVHSFLEMLPLMGLLLVVTLHWDQFIALFGNGTPRFNFAAKPDPLPWTYIAGMLVLTLVLEVLPYLEELVRGLRAGSPNRGRKAVEPKDGTSASG
jgi:hypothetical protein